MLKLPVLLVCCALSLAAQQRSKAVLWTTTVDLTSRDLSFGAGGEDHMPPDHVQFLREDLHGTSPKFDVKDDSGRKWKVKLGPEARSETAAAKLLWAVGYFADDDYYIANLKVDQLPHLKRGSKFENGDHVRGARLKLLGKDEKHAGEWHWRKNPFTGTRELNGLRVMMCVLNNWDLKDENNAIRHSRTEDRQEYLVSDLGSSFGRAGRSWTSNMSKDNPDDYRRSTFITKKTATYVDFDIAQHPPLLYVFNIVKPWRYWQFVRLRWIGKHIPRDDVRWIAMLLSQLSDAQIHEAFASSGYSESETASLAHTLKQRIGELSEL